MDIAGTAAAVAPLQPWLQQQQQQQEQQQRSSPKPH
jgi:hypothetical protein